MKKLLVLSAVLIACGVGLLIVLSRGGPRQSPATASRGEPDAVYATRGRIVMLPSSDSISAELQIHHEPIDTFVNPNGTVGMPAMIMHFPLGANSSLDSLVVGDAVAFDFAVWSTPGSRHYEARNLRKLPTETTLDLPE
jgi:Cu/Ag efflux protein CusF